MAVSKRFKAINFDLDTAALRQEFGEQGRIRAYADIRRHLETNGFEHRQGSGYRSLQALSDLDVVDIVVSLYRKHPWMKACVQKLDVTNIGSQYDLHSLASDAVAHSPAPIEFDLSL